MGQASRIPLMRIAYVCSGHFGPASGAGLTLWSMVKHIAPLHRVEIYANTWEPNPPAGVTMFPLPPIRGYPSSKLDFLFPLRVICNYFSATQLARRLGPEVDILHIYNGLASSPRLLVTQLMCQKAAMEERARGSLAARLSQQTPKHLLLRWLERIVYRGRRYRKLIPASRFEKEQILRYYDLPPDDIIPVHGGVDLAHYNPPDREDRRSVLRKRLGYSGRDAVALFVGYDFRRKGLPPLLRALSGINRRVKLLAVGGTGGMKACRDLTRELGLEGRVNFTGPVYRESRDYFFAADLFIFPTRFDPFGTAVLEAMAAGLPVITSRRVGSAELITPGKEGFLLDDPEDSRALAALVNRVVVEDKGTEMGAAGRQTARGCTWEEKAKEMLALYCRLV